MKSFGLKIFLAIFILTSAVGAVPTLTHANESQIYVTVDGKVLQFDTNPVKINGRTMVPLRKIFETLGAKVTWNAETQGITAVKDTNEVQLTIGSATAYHNGQKIELDAAPQLVNGSTMVPVRFIGESFGADVKWDDSTQTVLINTHGTAAAADSKKTYTTEEIGKFSESVVYIEVYDQAGKAFATGSGFVLTSDGQIATNYHVIVGASKAKVVFADNSSYSTTNLLYANKDEDLAVLKIDAKGLPAVQLGDSSAVKLGQKVVAIGSPLGLQNTLSEGVVSTTSRDVDGKKFIQITAPIDHGSSGGALFNMNGEVIGITSAAIESSASLNLAIPVKVLKGILQTTASSMQMPVGQKPSSSSTSTKEEDQLESYLNDDYAEVTVNDNHSFHFDYYVSVSKKDSNVLIVELDLTDVNEIKDMMALITEDESTIPGLLDYIQKDLHTKTTKSFLFVVWFDTNTSLQINGIPSPYITANTDGTKHIEYFYMAEIFDYIRKEITILFDPKDPKGKTGVIPMK